MFKIIKIVSGLVVLLIVGVVCVFLYIDRIAKAAVERGATRAMGVQTAVGSMDVGILSRGVEFERVKVANPEGFSSDYFLKLDKGDLAVNIGSLTKDKVIVPRLALTGIDMNLEKRKGEANYAVILEHLKGDAASGKTDPAKESTKKFVINELVIEDIAVHADLLGVGGGLTKLDVKVPEIRLKDVGSDSDRGVLISELSGIVTQAILDAVARKAGPLGLPADLAANIRGQLRELDKVTQTGVKFMNDLQGQFEGSLGGARESVDKVRGQIEGALGDLGGKKTESDQTSEDRTQKSRRRSSGSAQ